jgi:AcrR family transcriptional regulator
MGRWEPNARGRLEQAALELYLERGFDQTTVAEIAGRAGLTERTFFRHFTDKREVLFGGGQLAQAMATAIDGLPDTTSPLDAVAAALESTSDFFTERRQHARHRQAVINANPSLQERELIKLASLAAAMADALRRRGVAEPAASLAAEAGIAVFKVSFEHWVTDTGEHDLVYFIRDSLNELKRVTAPTP